MSKVAVKFAIKDYEAILYRFVWKYYRIVDIEFEELESQARLIFYECVNDFDSKRNVAFKAYLTKMLDLWLKSYVRNHLRFTNETANNFCGRKLLNKLLPIDLRQCENEAGDNDSYQGSTYYWYKKYPNLSKFSSIEKKLGLQEQFEQLSAETQEIFNLVKKHYDDIKKGDTYHKKDRLYQTRIKRFLAKHYNKEPKIIDKALLELRALMRGNL